MAQLADALQRGADGRTSRVALIGQPGIGISRLLDELQRRMAGLPGLVVARGTADEPSAGVPYKALSEAIDRALAATSDDRLSFIVGSAGHDLCALLPEITVRLDALAIERSRPTLEALDQRGSRMAESVLGIFERLGEDGVVLLVLEDLHWADPATRAFVSSLLRLSRALRLCLIVTFQPEVLHRRHPMRDLARMLREDERVETIEVRPLDALGLTSLVGALRGVPAPGSFMAAVVEGSRGNPLLATELVLATGTLDGVRLSDPFEQVLGARLDVLTTDAARVVRLLAAARRPVPRSTLLTARLPEGRITAKGLAEAIDSRLVVRIGPDGRPPIGTTVDGEDKASTSLETTGFVAIAHELYAEAIEELELAPERHVMHATLAELSAEAPAVAAWHWALASRPPEASQAHLRAAVGSESIDPGETTLYHYQRALEIGAPENGTGGEVLAGVLTGAAHAAAMSGAFRRAAAFTRRAIDVRVRGPLGAGRRPRDARLRRELGAMHVELGSYRRAGGDLVGGIQAMERALTLIPAEPSAVRAHAMAALAQQLMIDGRFEESARLAEQARAVALVAGHEACADYGHATCTLGVDTAYLSEFDRGLELLEEATEIARAEGRLDHLMRAYANRTTLLDLDSRREAALDVVKDGLRDARAGGLSATFGAFLRGNAADILFQLGRWSEAEEECHAAMEWPPSGVAWFNPTLYLALLMVESRADNEAARLVGQTLLQLESVPSGQWTALVQRAAVSLALWRGDCADAQAVAAREWDRVLATDDPAQIALAASTTLEAAAAATEEARLRSDFSAVAAGGQLAYRVLPEAERRLADSRLPRTLGARREAELHLETARSHLGRIRGRPSATAWGRVARAWLGIPLPYQSAKARWWQALAALHAGESRTVARDALHESWRLAEMLGARPLQSALYDLASRARIPLPEGATVGRGTAPDRPTAEIHASRSAEPGGAVAAPERLLVPVGPGSEPVRTATGRAIAERFSASREPTGATFGLSPREFEVLTILVEGRTNREIAERLFISERTVDVHVRRILAKLGVSGRVEAAALSIRLGLIPSGDAPGGRGPKGGGHR